MAFSIRSKSKKKAPELSCGALKVIASSGGCRSDGREAIQIHNDHGQSALQKKRRRISQVAFKTTACARHKVTESCVTA